MCGELSAINFPGTLSYAEYKFVGMGNGIVNIYGQIRNTSFH